PGEVKREHRERDVPGVARLEFAALRPAIAAVAEQVREALPERRFFRLFEAPGCGRGIELDPAAVHPGARPGVRVARAYHPGALQRAVFDRRVARRVARGHAGGAREQRGGSGEVFAVAGARAREEIAERGLFL